MSGTNGVDQGEVIALIKAVGGGGGGSGTDNYNDLDNKPKINNVTLSGSKSLDDLGIDASISYDDSETYSSGSVGSELSTLKSQIDDGLHTLVPVTLAADGWTRGLQTVTVTGVLADETEQMITIVPASTSRVEFERSMVKAVGQDYNTVTFSFLTVPKSDLSVYVIINNVGVAS